MALMVNALPKIRKPENAPFISFEMGSKERYILQKEIERLRSKDQSNPEILPLWINGSVITNKSEPCIVPHDFKRTLAVYSKARDEHVKMAIDTVLAARERWSQVPWFRRLFIFQRAAILIEKKYLIPLVAAVMEDYSKNPYEAFIDVQELIDFLNFNCWYAYKIYQEQPDSTADNFNMLEYLPLEGFVFSAAPNNFIAINGNLPTAPLIMGNVVIAKPSEDVVYSFHLFLKILFEAGLPRDVLAVLHGDEKMIGDTVIDHPMLSGVHFTGSTETFELIWKRVANNIEKYKSNPRVVGETGGKDFIVVYDDYDPQETAAAMVMGGFGAQGRKCSATSRVYMTDDMWKRVQPILVGFMNKIKVGDVADFQNYMGAIINEQEFRKIVGFIVQATYDNVWKTTEKGFKEIIGGNYRSITGWFVHPTVIVVSDPDYPTMHKEVFGPVITVCVLPKEGFDKEVLKICDRTSLYGLTGAVHTSDVYKHCEALQELRYAAGNMYDYKTTGAMVNKQPFSGGRKSGTNSKVGWHRNLREWVHTRTISLAYIKATDFAPPYLL